MQRAEEQVHVLECVLTDKHLPARVVQVHQTVDFCLCDLDLAAVVLKIVLKPVKGHFACHVGAALFVHAVKQRFKGVLVGRPIFSTQNDSGIAICIEIDRKAKHLTEITQLDAVVPPDIIDREALCRPIVDQIGRSTD